MTITIAMQRTYDHQHTQAPWLLTLYTGLGTLREWGCVGPDFPQARAVMDDYGNLVIVSLWK
jgi:hypothetical protein